MMEAVVFSGGPGRRVPRPMRTTDYAAPHAAESTLGGGSARGSQLVLVAMSRHARRPSGDTKPDPLIDEQTGANTRGVSPYTAITQASHVRAEELAPYSSTTGRTSAGPAGGPARVSVPRCVALASASTRLVLRAQSIAQTSHRGPSLASLPPRSGVAPAGAHSPAPAHPTLPSRRPATRRRSTGPATPPDTRRCRPGPAPSPRAVPAATRTATRRQCAAR